jgi:hypothetical protein
MTKPHKWSKAKRDERVPIIKRTREYIGAVRLPKFSKRKRAILNKQPTKLVFNAEGKLRRVLDQDALAKQGIVKNG